MAGSTLSSAAQVAVSQLSSTDPSDSPVLRHPGRPAAVNGPDLGMALLVRLGELPEGDPLRPALRAQAVGCYLPMAVYFARRFGYRGEPIADLTQVAAIGLIKAVDRYDPHRGVPFASFAIPTITGEVKRHFRDTAWGVRVPRRLQELSLRVVTATEDLGHVLHRPPTTAELAARVGVSPGEVLAARRAGRAYRSMSLERPVGGSRELLLIDSLGGPDPDVEAVELREALGKRLAELSRRERRIVELRYFAGRTQSEIAVDIGVSQMHVSRLLGRVLARLRAGLVADGLDRGQPGRQAPPPGVPMLP